MGDLMQLPRIGLLGDVNKQLVEKSRKTFSQGRVNTDIKRIVNGFPGARGRFFAITGPAGSGRKLLRYEFLVFPGPSRLEDVLSCSSKWRGG